METDPDHSITELAVDYAETYYKLTVVNINQKTADILADASFNLLSALAGWLVLIFLGMAASLWLGALMKSNALGFLVVGLLYLVLFLLFIFTRRKMFYPFIKNLVIKNIYE